MKLRPDTELAWARPIAPPETARPQPKVKPPAANAVQSRLVAQPAQPAQPAQGAAPAQSARIVPRGSFVNLRV